MKITYFVHKHFAMLMLPFVFYRGIAYLIDPVFFDNGWSFVRALWAYAYFVIWYSFHYFGL